MGARANNGDGANAPLPGRWPFCDLPLAPNRGLRRKAFVTRRLFEWLSKTSMEMGLTHAAPAGRPAEPSTYDRGRPRLFACSQAGRSQERIPRSLRRARVRPPHVSRAAASSRPPSCEILPRPRLAKAARPWLRPRDDGCPWQVCIQQEPPAHARGVTLNSIHFVHLI